MAKELFSVHDARAALYRQGADGRATGAALYQDCCLAGLRLMAEYQEERIERHGSPYASVHHVDEEHSIDIDHWWSFVESEGELLDPDLERNQSYVLVLVFQRERSTSWVKRVYFGVTARSKPIETGDVLTDNKSLRAERMVQLKGLASQPTMSAVIEGAAVWIEAGVETVAYTYDFKTDLWTSTGLVPTTTVGINEGGVGVPAGTDWYLALNTLPRLWLESDVLRMASLRARNDFELPNGGARVELRLDSTRYLVAMVSGEVIARNVVESQWQSRMADDMLILNGADQWRASLRASGIRCLSLTEAPLP